MVLSLTSRKWLQSGWLALTLLAAAGSTAWAQSSPVRPEYLDEIRAQFRQNGLREANVTLDSHGRVSLQGSYKDRKEVDLAFSIAQTTVGVRWVSPVTPEHIKVREWQEKIGDALSALVAQTGQAQKRPPAATSSSSSSSSSPSRPRTSGPDGAPGEVRNRYGLIVGVGKFQETRINPLAYASRDARIFYSHLINPNEGGFQQGNVALLTDEQATRSRIKAALDDIRMKAEEDDLVVVYFSSHGSPPDVNGLVNVVTYDTVVKPRHEIWSTAINGDILSEFITSTRAKRLVIVLDTCYSSGAYRRVQGFLPTGGKSLLADDEAVGVSRKSMAKLLGAKDLVIEDEAPASTGAKSLNGGWGKVLISASDNDERSWESERLKNSFFTFFFVEGLKRYGDVRESFQYAKPRVAQAVQQEKQEKQSPQAVASTNDWGIRIKR